MTMPICVLRLSNHQISFRYELLLTVELVLKEYASTVSSGYLVQVMWFVICQGCYDIEHAGILILNIIANMTDLHAVTKVSNLDFLHFSCFDEPMTYLPLFSEAWFHFL